MPLSVQECERLIAIIEQGHGTDRALDLLIERTFSTDESHIKMLDIQPSHARAMMSSVDDALSFMKTVHPSGYTLNIVDTAFGRCTVKLTDVADDAVGVAKSMARAITSASIGLKLKHLQKA